MAYIQVHTALCALERGGFNTPHSHLPPYLSCHPLPLRATPMPSVLQHICPFPRPSTYFFAPTGLVAAALGWRDVEHALAGDPPPGILAQRLLAIAHHAAVAHHAALAVHGRALAHGPRVDPTVSEA